MVGWGKNCTLMQFSRANRWRVIARPVIFLNLEMTTQFEEKSSEHIFRLLYVVRNAASYRSLKKYKDGFNQNYWILVFNNFYDAAVLEWCKVFGTDNEPTHWKTLVDDHTSFRKGLLARIGIGEHGWESYWKQVRDYRNNLITHHQKTPKVTQYPPLDNALEAAFFYYEWLVKKLDELGIIQEPENLKDYYFSCLEQSMRFSERAFKATKEIEEKVF